MSNTLNIADLIQIKEYISTYENNIDNIKNILQPIDNPKSLNLGSIFNEIEDIEQNIYCTKNNIEIYTNYIISNSINNNIFEYIIKLKNSLEYMKELYDRYMTLKHSLAIIKKNKRIKKFKI